MKNTLIKIGAMASIGAGTLLLTQPVWANSWPKCIGGGWRVTTYDNCSLHADQNGDSITYTPQGNCGGSRSLKGYYCAKQTQTPTTCATDAQEAGLLQRYDGTCRMDAIYRGNEGNFDSITIRGAQTTASGYSYIGPKCDDNGMRWYTTSQEILHGMCH